MSDGERNYSTYILNDRVGIYVIGFPVITRLDHLINLAELATLVGLSLHRSCWLSPGSSRRSAERRRPPGRALLREDPRELLPEAVSGIPCGRRAAGHGPGIRDAVRSSSFSSNPACNPTRSAWRRSPSASSRSTSRCSNASLARLPTTTSWSGSAARSTRTSTSIRDRRCSPRASAICSTSGLLPERTPGHVYRAIELERLASHVGQEVVGSVPHVLAAAPVRLRGGPGHPHRAARASPAGSGSADRRARSARAAGGGAVRAAGRCDRLLHGRAHRRSGQPADARDPAHRPRRLQRARGRNLLGRTATAGRRLQPHGRRSGAPAQRAGAHASPRGVGRNGAAGGARDQESAHADSAVVGTPDAREQGQGRTADAGARRVRDGDSVAGQAAAADFG